MPETQTEEGQYEVNQGQYEVNPEVSQGRKFAEKPNSTKKLTLLEDRNDLEDLATNSLSVSHSKMMGCTHCFSQLSL